MIKRFLISFALLFVFANVLFSQVEKNTLLEQLHHAKPDTAKIWLLHDVAKLYRMSSVDTMINYLQKALDLSRNLNFVPGEISSLHHLSHRYQFKGDKIKERAYTLEALTLSKQEGVDKWMGQIYNHLGSIYYWELKYDSAYYAYVKAEEMYQSTGQEYISYETKLNLFRLFSAQKEYEKAEAYLEEAYKMTKAKGIRMDLGWVLSKRTRYYFDRKDWEKYAPASEEYLQFINERGKPLRANVYHKAIFSYTDEKPEDIIQELEDIIPYHEKRNNDFSLLENYAYLGKLKRQIGDQKGAIDAYLKAEPLVKKTVSRTSEAELYKDLQETYAVEDNYAAAYLYQKKYHHIMDSLNSTDVQKNFGELEVKYETAKKDEALAQKELALTKSTQSRRLFIILAIAGSLLAVVALWFLYFKSRTNRLLKSQKQVIERSLKEKEILLKEIHHRVKNNLQVISSLLSWQSKYIDDEKALESMQEGRNRVQSMALIHQNLYQAENLTGVEVSTYIDKLGNSLFNSYNIKNDQIQFKSNVAALTLDVDTLIPLGLILNELLSNALKHAFPGGREGEIQVTLQSQEESLLLEVKDNGVGIPKEKEEKVNDSFGYKLIEAFADKLKAQLQIDTDYGTTVRLLIQNFKMT